MSAVVTEQPDSILSVIERMARDPAVDVDKLERLFALRERMVAADKKTAYNAAMNRAQAAMKPVYRDAMNNQTNSAYARLESICDTITPIYTAEGFSLSFDTADCPKADHIRTVCEVMHNAGHSEFKHFDLALDNVGLKGNPNKTAIQASGSTISYARRYLTLMVFNVVLTNEDNDGQGPIEKPLHETKGDSLNVIPIEEAQAMAKRMLDTLEADVDERMKAMRVLDLHDEVRTNSDLYIAASHQLNSKMRSAWKKYKAMAEEMQAEDAASDPNGRKRW
jgi:hypothetical protein